MANKCNLDISTAIDELLKPLNLELNHDVDFQLVHNVFDDAAKEEGEGKGQYVVVIRGTNKLVTTRQMTRSKLIIASFLMFPNRDDFVEALFNEIHTFEFNHREPSKRFCIDNPYFGCMCLEEAMIMKDLLT